MTSTALNAIREINALKRAIKDVERQLEECRNNHDYSRLNDQLSSIHIKMKIEAEALVSNLTTTIELSTI